MKTESVKDIAERCVRDNYIVFEALGRYDDGDPMSIGRAQKLMWQQIVCNLRSLLWHR